MLFYQFDTFGGITIPSFFCPEKASASIVLKLELVGISIFLRLLQRWNAPLHILVILGGI